MDITKGDYARFNSNTYLEVYEDIQEKAQKKYKDEVVAHTKTQEKLKKLEKDSSDEIETLKARISVMEDKEKMILKKGFSIGMDYHTCICRLSVSSFSSWHRNDQDAFFYGFSVVSLCNRRSNNCNDY